MSTLWSAATQVTTGLTLVAFIVAVAAWVYRTNLVRKERLIRTASDGDRAKLVENALEFFHVDTAGLTREQKYQLALEQIRARERRFLAAAKVVSLAAVLLTGVSAFAVARTTGGASPEEAAVPTAEVRKRLEDEIGYRIEPVTNLVRGDTLDAQVQAELSFVVFTSTPPSQHDFMVSRRRNVYAEYLDRNLESLFIELTGLVADGERRSVDRARDAVRRLDHMLHFGPKREVQLAPHVIDDVTVLSPPQIAAVRDTLIPALRPWLP